MTEHVEINVPSIGEITVSYQGHTRTLPYTASADELQQAIDELRRAAQDDQRSTENEPR